MPPSSVNRSLRPTTRLRVGVILAAALICLPAAANAGPWVPEPGEGYVKVSAGYFDGDGMFDVEGNFQEPDFQYTHRSIRAYTEIGLAPHVSITASSSFLGARNTRGNIDYIKRGFGDVNLTTKVGTTFNACAVAGLMRLRVPLYSETISADADATGANQQADASDRFTPALGDGSIDATPTASFGCAIPPISGWASLQAGPTFRSDGFGTSLSYAATIGSFVIPDRLGFQVRAGGVERLERGPDRPTKRYLQFSAGPIVRLFGPISLEASASYIPTGAFVSRGWSASAGISYDGTIFPNPWDTNDEGGSS